MKVVEGLAGYYFYHISKTGLTGKPALCGDSKVMCTFVPMDSWGVQTHLNERYCKKCEAIRNQEIEK